MSLSAIDSVLQQMRATALEAGIPQDAGRVEGAAASGGFAAELRRTLDKINALDAKADRQAEDFELGKPGVGINDVMVSMQKAGVAFQTGLQVRNKLVAAYQEIMNLPA